MTLMDLVDHLDAISADRPAILAKAFPALFPADTRPIGLDWPPGWTLIVAPALARVAELAEAAGVPVPVTQLKEKFGTIRAYVDRSAAPETVRREIDAVLDEAERASARRCAVCGREAERRMRSGWMAPACSRHDRHRIGPLASSGETLSAHARLALSSAFGSSELRGPALDREGVEVVRLWLESDGGCFRLTVRSEMQGLHVAVVAAAPPDPDDPDALDRLFACEAALVARAEAALGLG